MLNCDNIAMSILILLILILLLGVVPMTPDGYKLSVLNYN